MIEESIKHIEDRIKFSDLRPEIVIKKESAEAVLKELETYKKMAELLAEDKIIPKCRNCSDEDTHECTECALDWARNEVDSNEKK